jgi:hypothetical protein
MCVYNLVSCRKQEMKWITFEIKALIRMFERKWGEWQKCIKNFYNLIAIYDIIDLLAMCYYYY